MYNSLGLWQETVVADSKRIVYRVILIPLDSKHGWSVKYNFGWLCPTCTFSGMQENVVLKTSNVSLPLESNSAYTSWGGKGAGRRREIVLMYNDILPATWLAQLVERRTAVREVEGSSPRPDQYSGS